MSVLGLKLEDIACNTPEQNGHIESFHKTLKKDYIWPYDFRTYQVAEAAIRDAFVDYNRDRIHSSLGYLTPHEFVSKWKQEHQREMEEVSVEQQTKVKVVEWVGCFEPTQLINNFAALVPVLHSFERKKVKSPGHNRTYP